MREIGIVANIKGDKATITLPRKSACDKCRMCLAAPEKDKVTITLNNQLGAIVGDKVAIEMSGGYVMTAAFIVYLMPLIFAVAGLIIGINLWNEGIAIILTLTGLIIGFILVIIIDRRLKQKKGFAPRITEIVNNEQGIVNNGGKDD